MTEETVFLASGSLGHEFYSCIWLGKAITYLFVIIHVIAPFTPTLLLLVVNSFFSPFLSFSLRGSHSF